MTREEINRRIVDLKLSLDNEPMMGSVQKKAILDNLIMSIMLASLVNVFFTRLKKLKIN